MLHHGYGVLLIESLCVFLPWDDYESSRNIPNLWLPVFGDPWRVYMSSQELESNRRLNLGELLLSAIFKWLFRLYWCLMHKRWQTMFHDGILAELITFNAHLLSGDIVISPTTTTACSLPRAARRHTSGSLTYYSAVSERSYDQKYCSVIRLRPAHTGRRLSQP